MTLYLLNYNNYYNRIVKQESNLTAYLNYAIPFSTEKVGIEGVNFNPNDGVDTEQIINWNNTIPDYLVVAEDNDIRSRWFITEMARTRGGQYKLTLHRDVIVDNYINVLNAQIFIDKAKAQANDIAIYNKEPYKFNSIKQSETLLMDDTGCSWIVGYVSADDAQASVVDNKITGNVRFPISDEIVDYSLSNTDAYFDLFSGISSVTDSATQKTFNATANISIGMKLHYNGGRINLFGEGNADTWTTRYTFPTSSGEFIPILKNGALSSTYKLSSISSGWYQNGKRLINSIIYAYSNSKHYNTEANIQRLIEEDGKILKAGTKYYTINVERVQDNTSEYVTASMGSVYSSMQEIKNSIQYYEGYGSNPDHYTLGDATNESYFIENNSYKYRMTLEEVQVSITYELPDAAHRPHLTDAPYDMFCIPYNSSKKFYRDTADSSFITNSNKHLNFASAMSIAADLSGVGFVYDVQLLPYCPLGDNYLRSDGNIMTRGTNVGYIKASGDILGVIMFCTQSTWSFSIPVNISIDDIKQQHQTDNWRFNSPNWSGSYDFDVTLNKGLDYVDVDCTYKPYTPYIHVCPRFKSEGFYGYNNKDAIGLICGGDFSLPVISDQWKTYEYQNKNYQNTFDRQIQNVNRNYQLDTYERGANALMGIVSGASSGAVAGATFGPVGAAIGGIAGGVLSAGAGAADMVIAKKRKEEAVSYATDQFNYQIDNIQSLPYTLSKVSAFNTNNKLFPFIEYFSCSGQEKQIFNELVRWNGMTINRVGKLNEFIEEDEQYFSGRLIRIDIEEDFHMVAAIAQELSKGVFV